MNNSSSSNGLGQFCRQNELTKLSEDNCYLQRRDYDSRKPYRWQTYHYHPYGCKVQATCYPGQFYKDGYGIGGANVDADSCVKIHPGNVLTNPNVRQELPTLPVQLPRIRGYYDADIDSDLRPDLTESYASCNNTSEKSFMPYRFQRFDHLCYNPQDPRFVLEELTFNCTYPNGKFWHRAGEDTRHNNLEKYRNGCDYRNKYYPPSLSFSSFGY